MRSVFDRFNDYMDCHVCVFVGSARLEGRLCAVYENGIEIERNGNVTSIAYNGITSYYATDGNFIPLDKNNVNGY